MKYWKTVFSVTYHNIIFLPQLNTLRAGKLDVPDAMDYFVHTRGLWPKIPPYAVGRFTWDSWMLHSLLHPKVPQGK